MSPGAYAWSAGPADARTVRVLLYLAEGLAGGGFVSLATSMAVLAIGAGPGILGIFVLFLVLSTRWAAFYQFRSRGATRWELQEWIRVRRWTWTVLLVGLIGGGLLSLQLRSMVWVVVSNLGINQFLLLSGFLCAIVALRLGSKGEVDPATLTLSYDDRREVDLRFLSDVRRFSVGGWTVLWLSAPRGYEDRRALQGLYVLPSATLARVWHVFEAGLETDVETPAGYRPSRSVIYAGIGVIGGTGLAVFAVLSAAGQPPLFAAALALTTFGLIGAVVVAAEFGVI